MKDASGKTIFPGYSPGGEAGPAAWALWITGDDAHHTTGSLINGFATGYFADMVFDKPDWRIDGQNVSDDLAAAEKKTGEALDSSDPDLSAFRAAGGKLIQYHGWNDAGIPPQDLVDYYEQSASKMGGVDNIRSFYRLFMAPGMDHCGGGPAPSAIGGVFGLPSVSRDPGHDVVAALAHWVEDGVRRIRSSRRAIATTIPRKASTLSVLGAPTPRRRGTPAKAIEARRRATPAWHPRSERELPISALAWGRLQIAPLCRARSHAGGAGKSVRHQRR